MAKRQRLKSKSRPETKVPTAVSPTERSRIAIQEPNALLPGSAGLDPIKIATGLLGGAIVYLCYHPSDSVAVERGDALWFGLLAIAIGTISWASFAWTRSTATEPNSTGSHRNAAKASCTLDTVAWTLAAWVMIAAFATSPPGNLRMATNEAWLWVAAAAIFTSVRRLTAARTTRMAIVVLLVACASGLAVHGLHQYFVSLPLNRLDYAADPEAVLQMAGVDAPPDSAERMVFENRLFDGGPTATFALANSFAAFLLFGIVLSAGVLRFQWNRFGRRDRLLWSLPVFVCFSALLGTRSRSAILATLVGLALVLVVSWRSGGKGRSSQRRSKPLLIGLAGVSLIGISIALVVAVFGNREWFEEAPASLAVRFQYWRSTWQMVLERPWMGCGPGNFQSAYERFREANTTEQIAEPHNFLFETLASSGFIGLGLLLTLFAVGVWFVAIRDRASGIGLRVSGFGCQVSGDRVSGDRVSGDRVSGDRVSGDQVSGDRVSGDRASGDRASGEDQGFDRW